MKERNVNGLIIFLLVAMLLGILRPAVAAEQSDEARIKQLEKDVKDLKDQMSKGKSVPGAIPDWVNNLKFFGDFRYRYEWIDDEDATKNQERHRIRARINLNTKANDEVDLGFRLASGGATSTGEGDPTSTNQTLDTSFSTKNLWLDLAYFNYHPESIENLNVYGGKIKSPFFTPGKSELLWDHDLNPEGLAATYSRNICPNLKAFGTTGAFYIEQSATSSDSRLLGFQGGVTYDIPDREKTYLTAGASWFDFDNTSGKAVFGNGAKGNSNTGGGAPTYTESYAVAELFAEFGMPCHGKPLKLFYEYIKNTQVGTNDGTGWLIGASLGKCKKPGSYALRWNYREIKKDATIGTFNDSDFIGGGTAGKGHEFGIGYQLAKNWQFATTYFWNRTTDTDAHFDRLQVDFKYKF